MQVGAPPAMGHQVDSLGRIAGINNLAAALCADELCDTRARLLIPVGGDLAHLVHATVDVGVGSAVVIVHRIQHYLWLLRSGRAVEIDQGLAVHRARQNREVGTYFGPVYRATPL